MERGADREQSQEAQYVQSKRDGYSCSGELRDKKICVAAEHVKRSYAVFLRIWPVVRVSLASSFRSFAPPLHRSSTRSLSLVERIDGLISLRKILLWRICKDCVVVYTR